jgi:DnaJ-class molecular chaperone
VVDPGTIPGTVLRFGQKGIPNMGYGGKGDFLIELNVKIPNDLTEDQKEWLKEQKDNKIFQ